MTTPSSSLHKVVVYPNAALRHQQLAAENCSKLGASCTIRNNDSKNVKSHLLLANINTVNPSPIMNKNRPRALSAGRTRQSTAHGLVKDIYDRLGVNRTDLNLHSTQNGAGLSDENNALTKRGLDNFKSSPTNFSAAGTFIRPFAASRYHEAAQRGGGRPQTGITPTENPLSVGSKGCDATSHRRSKSLSRGNILTSTDQWWLPVQNRNLHSPENVSISSSEAFPSCQPSYRTTPDNVLINNIDNIARSINHDFSDEKKEDCNEEPVRPVSSQECEDEILRVTPPSVKDRSRIYGGTFSDVAATKDDGKKKNNASNKTPKSTLSSPSPKFDPKYETQFASRTNHPPKIDIYQEIATQQQKEKKLDLVCNTKDQSVTSAKEEEDQPSLSSKSESKKQQQNNYYANCGVNSNNLISPSSHASKKHSSGDLLIDTSPSPSVHGKAGSLAEAFLAAIKTPQSTPNRGKCAPVIEINTSEEMENETNGDSISMTMSSVSVDEFPRSIRTDTNNSHHGAFVHGAHGTYYTMPNNNRSRTPNNNSSSLLLEGKKPTGWQNERNKLGSYISNTRGCFTIDCPSSPRSQNTPTNSSNANNNSNSNNNTEIYLARMESIIEERVHARISEYESRMERMMLKFMQTVDEKMSSRLGGMESKMNTVNLALQNLQLPQQHHQQNNQYRNFKDKNNHK